MLTTSQIKSHGKLTVLVNLYDYTTKDIKEIDESSLLIPILCQQCNSSISNINRTL